MYVIAGVTGHVGSVAARTLLERREKVRAIVRDADKGTSWKTEGAEVVVGNLADPAFLASSLRGAAGAFVLLPPDYSSPDLVGNQRRLADAIAQGVKESGVPHVVLLSSVGAQHPEGNGPIRGLHYLEHKLAGAAAARTYVRAAYFMENWGQVIDPVKDEGILPSFFHPTTPIAMVATQDIGELVADRLLHPPSPGATRIIELAGPRDYTPADVAEAFGRLVQKPVELVNIPAEGASAALVEAGLPQFLADAFAEMYAGLNRGHVAWQVQGTEMVRGKVPLPHVLWPLLQAEE